MVLTTVTLLTLAACGGGTGSQPPNGSLSMRALWEQSATHSQRGTARAAHGGFGPTIPASVRTVVIKFQSAAEPLPRCVAVDPTTTPIDPTTGQRLVVLRQLPGGPGTVTISGFATDVATATEICQGLRFNTPSFSSNSQPVEIVPGTRTDAGDIDVFALPFPLENTLHPPPDSSTATPVTIDFTLAAATVEGVGGIDPQSITIDFTQGGGSVESNVEPTLTTCDDVAGPPCSPNGTLGVAGFVVQSMPLALDPGAATIYIHADIIGGDRPLDFTYTFTVLTPAAGVVEGTVVDCLTGRPIAAATVEAVDPQLAPVASDANGHFRIESVPFGSFALNATATGFIDSRVTGTLTPANPDEQLTIALCPTGGTALRIVLTWGSGPPAPADLDAHLRGPAPGTMVAGAPVEFHLDFANPTITFPVSGGATLDIDSTKFSGPETDTVDQLISGTYHFCVHDFSDRLSTGSPGLANSDARVRVFLGNEQNAEFLVPSGAGNVWDVFRIDTTGQVPAIVPVNTLTDESDRERVCRRPDDTDGDGLTDAQEAVLGTAPNNPDTNANGISDGQDVIDGTNPLPPGTGSAGEQ
jgi:hypothetical protein